MTGTSLVGNGPVLKRHWFKPWYYLILFLKFFSCTKLVCSIIQFNISSLHIYLKWDIFFVFNNLF